MFNIVLNQRVQENPEKIFITYQDRQISYSFFNSMVNNYYEKLKTKKDEYYWHELIGLNVMNSEKRNIGIVDGLFSSGDNDVLIVKNDERKDDIYIPCTKANIIKITTTYIQVRWDNEI